MIAKLSCYYRKEIALFLFSTFLSGLYGAARMPGEHLEKFSIRYQTRSAFSPDPLPPVYTSVKKRHETKNNVEKTTEEANRKPSPDVDGPGQPEMQSFQSVNANNMVDLFTGDFSYNIPLLDVGGYPVNIHYSSGISMDQEASWVGLGWNINPGAITRNMRGLPDDFNGADTVVKTLSVKDNITAGVTADLNPEFLGIEKNLGLNTGLYYNNYTGPNLEIGISPTVSSGKFALGDKTYGVDTLNLGLDLNFKLSSANGFSVHPTLSATLAKGENGAIFSNQFTANFSTRNGLMDLSSTLNGPRKAIVDEKSQIKSLSSYSSSITFAKTAYVPKVTTPFTSFQFSFRVKAGGEFFGIHPLLAVGGYYSQQYIQNTDTTSRMPAYGYMHFEAANNNPVALLDFNRESDLPYSKKLPHTGIPLYTYDTYSMSGEGTGGMFRPYRGDIGYVNDHVMKTKNHSGNLSLDLGVGNLVHGGADISYNYSYTANRQWETENSLRSAIGFRTADSSFEAVYFRNPSEKTTNAQSFYAAVGGTDLVRNYLGSSSSLPQATNKLVRYGSNRTQIGTLTLDNNALKKVRDKRGQVISYLTAYEASKVGLDTAITIYPVNLFPVCTKCDTTITYPGDTSGCTSCRTLAIVPTTTKPCDSIKRESRLGGIRKSHHLSQITVLNPDGRTYVYGLPVYNTVQKEVTFSVNSANANYNTGLVSYTPGAENSVNNSRGKDHFYSSETMPAYAHSFLLTGLLSPDYADVKGDGITDDDKGDAIKFNYSRIYSSANPYRWRIPQEQDSANYTPGLKTDNSDDKGSYVYGEKEIWYLHSIESKNMIATFTLDEFNVSRSDNAGVNGENGGRNASARLKRLDRIDLYSKKDLARFGLLAKPIKTVHFTYNNSLCTGAPGGPGGSAGKLTLASIYFEYNRNVKGSTNPYVFTYHDNNPSYVRKNFDRWGNYKNPGDNPGGLENDDYPYVLQNGSKAASNVRAWTLAAVKLPSGGKIAVEYESDDYAFVQNKRALQMFALLGFNTNGSFSSITSNLYSGTSKDVYAFVKLAGPVSSNQAFYQQYLEGVNKLYFKVLVKMPGDAYGSGYEYVPCYVDYEGYQLEYPGADRAWIKLKPDNGKNPLFVAAAQFLRLNLPSKAFPGSDLRNDNAPAAVVKTLFSLVSNIKEIFTGFEKRVQLYGWLKDIQASKSFVRLNNPIYQKYGGGLRVKTVQIFDNWNKMTGQKEAVYGQRYRYTTVREIHGVKQTISSGVATYEPSIGNEENPFHVPLEYAESYSLVGPTFDKYIDNPVAETCFPSPSVGYSQVRVYPLKRTNTRSANGFEQSEFYTAYDFPVISEFTPFDNGSRTSFTSPLGFFIPDSRRYTTLSQGFKIELNDMHGKLKSQSSFAENDSLNPLSYTRNFYRVENQNAQSFKLSNVVSTLKTDGSISQNTLIGKDIEMMVDLKEQRSETIGANVQINNDAFVFPFFFPIFLSIPSFIPKPTHSLNIYRAAAILKVVNSYGVLDSVVHFEKGSQVAVKNEVYDEETGDPVVVRTQNGFNDPVYTFTYPAHAAYEGVGPAYKNIGAVLYNKGLSNGLLTDSYFEKFFVHGDEVMVTGKGMGCASTIPITKKMWVLDGARIGNASNRFYFIDRDGKTFSDVVDIKVIRSGRRNVASTVGSVTCLRNPVRYVSGGYRIVLDDTSKVLNASAATMSERWLEDLMRYTCLDSTKLVNNPFLQGTLGNWRGNKSYVYYGLRAETNPTTGTDLRKNGSYAEFSPYWTFGTTGLTLTTDTTKWVWNSEITMFNRKGYEIENRDPLGRYNSGLYGYGQTLPVAVAQNAKYREIAFEGFEDHYNSLNRCDTSCFEINHNGVANPLLDSTYKHTGRYSVRVNPGHPFTLGGLGTGDSVSSPQLFPNYCISQVKDANYPAWVPLFSPTSRTKIVLSAWVKELDSCRCKSYSKNEIDVNFTYRFGLSTTYTSSPFYPSGNIIEGWQRYESVVTVPPSVLFFSFIFKATGDSAVFFDDIRIHPFNANLKSFVYHPTNLRLMAELDENNYATLYEYDDDGTLVRVKKETQRGIKTIKETRSALTKLP